MSVSLELNTPLADALSNVVQPKLVEVGWSTGGLDDSALAEYIILMLVNGKTQEQIAAELSNDLLSLPPDDSGALDFARWLWDQVETLNQQLNGNILPQNGPVAQHSQAQAIPSFTGPENGGSSRRGSKQSGVSGAQDTEMSDAMDGVQNGSIPTGPKSMRNGGRPGNKRQMGQISKAMDRSNEARSNDAVLHRIRDHQGIGRIGMQNRQPPKGPRSDGIRQRGPQIGIPSGPGNASAHHRAPMQMPPQMQMMPQMHMTPQQESQFRAMCQQMLMGMLPAGVVNPAFSHSMPPQSPQAGRPLSERVQPNPHRQNGNPNARGAHFRGNNFQNGNSFQVNGQQDVEMDNQDVSSSMEVESSQPAPAELSPDIVCKFNLKCTKADCIFAHQSPAAPPGTAIDVNDHCPFGAACKNRKCVARHPSPAQRISHQSEQDCKFFPNCTNAACLFRHPTMPMCRNGADCTREGCKFTHVKTKCRFNPCLNPGCIYKHEEGQKRGAFDDKVWQADESQEREHVSERKFVVGDEGGEEELIVPGNQAMGEGALATEVVT
ncbi:hypothetical protein MMC30_007674 [Trapelia coarctata]|nr:hypothetical protein [Trapelia coarctata]